MDRIVDEPGFRISLPHEASFRFSESAAYRGLSGQNVSEMDVGWWDEAHESISLLEVKDYSTREPVGDLLPKLVAKGRDCLVMLHAVWHGLSDAGRALGEDLPERCRAPRKLRLLFVLRVGKGGLSREQIPLLKDNLENHIKAYAELLGIRRLIVALMDHEKAIEKKLPIALVD